MHANARNARTYCYAVEKKIYLYAYLCIFGWWKKDRARKYGLPFWSRASHWRSVRLVCYRSEKFDMYKNKNLSKDRNSPLTTSGHHKSGDLTVRLAKLQQRKTTRESFKLTKWLIATKCIKYQQFLWKKIPLSKKKKGKKSRRRRPDHFSALSLCVYLPTIQLLTYHGHRDLFLSRLFIESSFVPVDTKCNTRPDFLISVKRRNKINTIVWKSVCKSYNCEWLSCLYVICMSLDFRVEGSRQTKPGKRKKNLITNKNV